MDSTDFRFQFTLSYSKKTFASALKMFKGKFLPNSFNWVKKDEIEEADFLACSICVTFTPLLLNGRDDHD